MMTYIDHPESKTVELLIDGAIHENDYRDTVLHLEKKITEWGSVNLLEIIHSFDGFNISVFWDRIKLGLTQFEEIKKFPREDILEARKWCVSLRRRKPRRRHSTLPSW